MTLQQFRNYKKQPAYAQAGYYTSRLLAQRMFSYEELIKEMVRMSIRRCCCRHIVALCRTVPTQCALTAGVDHIQ